MTADDLLKMKIIDEIILEPLGGAHRNPEETIKVVGVSIKKNLGELTSGSVENLVAERYRKFRTVGSFIKEVSASEQK